MEVELEREIFVSVTFKGTDKEFMDILGIIPETTITGTLYWQFIETLKDAAFGKR